MQVRNVHVYNVIDLCLTTDSVWTYLASESVTVTDFSAAL